MAIYDFFKSIMLRSVAVEHCDHRAPGGTIFPISHHAPGGKNSPISIVPLAAKMFYCSIWPLAV
jgi:hypothetical protein